MLMFLYHFAWTVAFFLLWPAIGLLTVGSRNRGDSGGVASRFLARIAGRSPHTRPRGGGIWVHALSVGEVISSLPLVEALARDFPEREIVVTATTRAGLAVARERLGSRVRVIFYMPLDAWWAVRKTIDFVMPSMFILVETDLWPGLLAFLKGRGVPSLLVNGRISPRTLRAYLRAPSLVRRVFDPLCACLMQSDLDRDRLLMTGIGNEKVITAGNIKFDFQTAPMGDEERHGWLGLLGLKAGDPVWVAGSTHEGEEEIILDAFKKLRARTPRLRLLLAPRDPGRAHDLATLAAQRGLKARLRSHPTERGHDLIVLDSVGELNRLYGLGTVCFVGGSLVPVGGHNLLEPAAFGVPVLFGPHTHNFVSMAAGLLEAGGGRQVHSVAELYTILERLLKDDAMRTLMGSKARRFVERNRGALDKVLSHVRRCMGEGA